MRSSGLRRLIYSFYVLDSEHLWGALAASGLLKRFRLKTNGVNGIFVITLWNIEVAVVTRPLRFRRTKFRYSG